MALGMIAALAVVAGGTAGAAHAAQEGGPIPPWVKTVFGYYMDGNIGDSEVINALQHLIDIGVITMPVGGGGEPAAAERAAVGRAPPTGGDTADVAKAAYERAAAEREAAEREAAEREAAAAEREAAAAEHAANRTVRAAELKAAWKEFMPIYENGTYNEQLAVEKKWYMYPDAAFEETWMWAAAGDMYYQAANKWTAAGGGGPLSRAAAAYEKAAANWEAARAAAEWMFEAGNPDPPYYPAGRPDNYTLNDIDYNVITYLPLIVIESPGGKEISAYTWAAQTWAAGGDNGRAAAAYEKAARAAARADISTWTPLDTAITVGHHPSLSGGSSYWRYALLGDNAVDFKLLAAGKYERAAEAWAAAGDDGRAAAAYEKAATAIAP